MPCEFLLDNDHMVVIRKNGLGTYSAISVKRPSKAFTRLYELIDKMLKVDEQYWPAEGDTPGISDAGHPDPEENVKGVVDTDGRTVEEALRRLNQKAR